MLEIRPLSDADTESDWVQVTPLMLAEMIHLPNKLGDEAPV
jgi:hypothetical protein